jgi:alpha-beta hydrolase superfamily lysophospholipase
MPLLPPQIEFYAASDGRRLAVRVWRAKGTPRGRVVFLHGITSHGGWYHRSCAHLATAGIEVHFLDRRGSGLNVDGAGDVDKWETWIDDVGIYLKRCQVSGVGCQENQTLEARNLTPDTRNLTPILSGISWGGKLAVAVARKHPELLGGLALICPGLFSYQEPGLFKRLALAMLPARLAQRRVAIPLGDPALFIDNRRGQQFVATDPLSLRSITLRFAQQDGQLTQFARKAASYLRMPLLLMLAGRDRIVANRPTRKFFARAGGASKTLIEYPNATHTLEFEPEPERYFADLANWLAKTQGC